MQHARKQWFCGRWGRGSGWVPRGVRVAVALACLTFGHGAHGQTQDRVKSTTAPSNTTEIRKNGSTTATALKPTLIEATPAALASDSSVMLAIAVTGAAMQPRLALTLSDPVRLRAFALADPYRIVIEGAGLTFSDDLALALPAGGLLADYRFGKLDGDRGRLVLETTGPVRVTHLEAGPSRQDGQLTATFALAMTSRNAVLALQTEPPLTLDLQRASAQTPTLARGATGGKPGLTPLVMPVIMIDPGHGGRDPGAVADGGALEKDVVLAVARRLKAVLAATGRYDLRMTRETDVALTLDQRVAASTAARPSLFISLHADTFAGQPSAAAVRGGSVYVLSDRASNLAAQALAEKENTADLRAGLGTGSQADNSAVDTFLSDLMARETQTFATDFQASLVKSLRGVMTLAREPARAASFQVLKQTGAPAVLVELGYMSHAQDIGLLQSPDWQMQVATAIARAVDAYFAATRQIVGRR